LFLEEAQFNDHLTNGKSIAQPSNILNVYANLAADQDYPLDDLVPAGMSLQQLLSGALWMNGALWGGR
jgi:hypothetical protein